jgi:hypothetical protein
MTLHEVGTVASWGLECEKGVEAKQMACLSLLQSRNGYADMSLLKATETRVTKIPRIILSAYP